MSPFWRRILGLGLPPILFCLCDCTITLAGQPSQYWAGDYSQCNELSPTFNQLLQIHPLAFVAGTIVYIGIVLGIITLLPATPALIISIALTFGHTVGVCTWLIYRFQFAYQVCNGMFLIAAIILGLSIRYGWQATPSRDLQLQGWHPLLRWVLAATLFGIGIYLFVWPREV